jgi:hypothetical protein
MSAMIANIVHVILASGLMLVVPAVLSGIFSSGRAQDESAGLLLTLGLALVVIGGAGSLIVRFA